MALAGRRQWLARAVADFLCGHEIHGQDNDANSKYNSHFSKGRCHFEQPH
jgi:hypothetical protein